MKVMLMPLAMAAMFFSTGIRYQYTKKLRLRRPFDGKRLFS
jgi:hypothetical protein